MSDPRITPVNARVAAAHLSEVPPGLARVRGAARQILVPVADLLRAPDGARDRQILFGETVDLFEDRDGWCFVQARKDGYVGYLRSTALGPAQIATHWVSARSTHVYEAADAKARDLRALSFGSRITARAESGAFVETEAGFLPKVHLLPADQIMNDPVAAAALLLGTPYLWGGNSAFGIDCSGLVQAALTACGVSCPGDSDQQARGLGRMVPAGAEPRRGDLFFWKGHVAWVADPETLLHANAHHMAVAFEPLQDALSRIEAQEGPPLAHRRF